MRSSLIFYNIILSLLIISAGVSVYYKKYTYTYGISVITVMFASLVFGYMWRESYDVHPESKNINYKNKVLWVNVDKIDVLNAKHNKWAKELLLNHAPNKLGIYSDKYNVTTLDILKYKETFYELFGYNTDHIMFKNAKLNNRAKKFCNDKNLKIKGISFRIN